MATLMHSSPPMHCTIASSTTPRRRRRRKEGRKEGRNEAKAKGRNCFSSGRTRQQRKWLQGCSLYVQEKKRRRGNGGGMCISRSLSGWEEGGSSCSNADVCLSRPGFQENNNISNTLSHPHFYIVPCQGTNHKKPCVCSNCLATLIWTPLIPLEMRRRSLGK
jgi:hypothetical protein